MSINAAASYELTQRDPVIGRLLSLIKWASVDSTNNVFHDLASCVIEQQIHYRSRRNFFGKMLSSAQLDQLTPDNWSAFEEGSFRTAKLSAKKYTTLSALLEYFSASPPDFRSLSDEAIQRTLTDIPGISDWTVDMIRLYTLGRPDVFPIDDYQLKLAFSQFYGLEGTGGRKSARRAIGSQWSPYSSVAVRALLLARQQSVVWPA